MTTASLPFERPDPLATPPEYAQLRARTPVARVTTADGQPAWLVVSYQAALEALADPRLRMAPPGQEPVEGAPVWDGEPHARLRRLVAKAFTPRQVESMRPRIEQLAHDQAAALAEAGPPADLVAQFAAPLSIAVLGELLGSPIDERDRFRSLANAASAADPFAGGSEEEATAAWAGLGGYAAELVARKRERLGTDLLSNLITVHDAADGRLDDAELVTLVTVIVASGYLTATSAISVGVLQLVTADVLGPVAVDDDLDATVAELLRLQVGLVGEALPRWAHEDIELAGVTIPKGDQVLVRLEAGNRDPAQFTEPDRFRPGRQDTSRLTFGRGAHHCLGAALARVEIAAALRALADTLPGLRLAGSVDDIVWARSHADAGPTALEVTW